MEKRKMYRRSLVIFSIVVVIGITCYTVFNYINVFAGSPLKRELAREIQRIKDKGEPVTIEELIPEEIPDDENGALLYKEAFKLKEDLQKRYKEKWKYIPYEGSIPWNNVPGEEKEKVKNLLLYDSDFLRFYELLEKASSMKCQFVKRKDYEKGSQIMLPHLSKLRSSCRLLFAMAQLQADKGEIDKALNTSLTTLKVAKSLSNEPVLISQLVRGALDQIALAALQNILEKGEGSKSLYRVLIEEIRKERKETITHFAMLGERVIFGMQEFPRDRKEVLEMGEEERKKKLKEMLWNEQEIKDVEEAFLKAPETFFDNQQIYYLKTMAEVIPLTKEPYWQAKEKFEALEKKLQELPKEKAILAQMLMPSISRPCMQESSKLDAQLGNAEIALACHIYKMEHGYYPSSLKELIPGILPSLPLDPFTGKDYVYRKKGGGFLVYSLGDNLKDDGGEWGEPRKWQGDFDIVWKSDK